MNKRLYKLMDWAFIEEVIYSECSHPSDILGPHLKGQTTLVQAFFPDSDSVVIRWKERDEKGKPSETKMEVADDDGFYAQLLPTKDPGPYSFVVTYEERQEDGKTLKKKVLRCGDCYRHKNIISDENINRFLEGRSSDACDFLGAHVMTLDSEEGTLFAVHAPSAMRVSVIGDFNSWDGRTHQMNKRGETGIFELFVPGVGEGERYQFELKFKNYEIHRTSDPYALRVDDNEKLVCIVEGPAADEAKNPSLKKRFDKDMPLSVYQADPYRFVDGKKSAFANMADTVPELCVKSGFSHVCLGNVLSSSGRRSDRILSYFAVDSRLGNADELKAFIDKLHASGIKVILDWIPSYFAPESGALSRFDGTGLFEHIDPRQGYAADIDACLFNYSSNTVTNFLLSSGFNLVKRFGADGIRMCSIARMLYLDYSKSEWVPNIYGGNENLDAIAFIKKFNAEIKKLYPGILLIADDSSLHQKITDPVSEDGFGFDYKWNEVYYDDFRNFICMDPLFRGPKLHLLADSMTYAFVDDYLLPFSGREKSFEIGRLFDLLSGDDESKSAQIRLSLGYLYSHPGKKLIGIDLDEKLAKMLSDLNGLYKKEPALYKAESNPECFEWLSNMNCDQACISFVRKTDDPEDMLVFVFNFSGIEQNFSTGVPYEGKYKEIFTTDDKAYGGTSSVSRTVRKATDKRIDGRTQSISVKIRPQSMIMMKFIPYTEEELEKVIEQRIRSYTPIKKTKK